MVGNTYLAFFLVDAGLRIDINISMTAVGKKSREGFNIILQFKIAESLTRLSLENHNQTVGCFGFTLRVYDLNRAHGEDFTLIDIEIEIDPFAIIIEGYFRFADFDLDIALTQIE